MSFLDVCFRLLQASSSIVDGCLSERLFFSVLIFRLNETHDSRLGQSVSNFTCRDSCVLILANQSKIAHRYSSWQSHAVNLLRYFASVSKWIPSNNPCRDSCVHILANQSKSAHRYSSWQSHAVNLLRYLHRFVNGFVRTIQSHNGRLPARSFSFTEQPVSRKRRKS